MKKRIFGFMSLNIIFCVTVFALLITVLMYERLTTQMKEALKSERVTVISEFGEVVFDNYANPADLDNHLDRPEVADAFRFGTGESERFSDSLLETSYYYAMRLDNGQVLRLSFTISNIYYAAVRLLPVLALCVAVVVLVSSYMANKFTNKVIEPINKIDLNADEIDTYDELAPLVARIHAQKREIALQFEALENRANTITAIIESMTEGLMLTDEKGVILSANTSAEEIFANTEHKTQGKNIIEVCRDKGLINAAKRCFNGERAEFILECGVKTYNVFCNPVFDISSAEPKVSGAVILFLNITEKAETERQRREFSANVSHELKTPLTTISGFVEMLEKGMVKEEDKPEFLAKISAQTNRLKAIVEDIIKLSEFDEGRATGGFGKVAVLSLAQNVAQSLQNKAREKNVALSVKGEDVVITGVSRMLDEMLYNLTDNGIKYNNDGGKVTITVAKDGKNCVITVEDTGIGIPEESLPHVFERFYTADKSRSRKLGGTGLGLSIVKHSVRYHKGSVDISSTEGAGTRVTCTIPI